MYTSFYGMSCNPFIKDESIKYKFESEDYNNALSRFKYLKEIKGIGLITGESGFGKTYVIRSFINDLNKDLYKVIYISALKDMSVFDFFKVIADKLNIGTGPCYKTDLYNRIQSEIERLVKFEKVQPIIIIDDAHFLTREILLNFKILYDFEMDSKDYITLILIGQPLLREELAKSVHIQLKQRIIVNYTFNGLKREEAKEYIESRLELANTKKDIFEIEAINGLYSACRSSIRRLNNLIINALMLGYQNKEKTINTDIVMNAKNEMDI